jgi:hypothetical protein
VFLAVEHVDVPATEDGIFDGDIAHRPAGFHRYLQRAFLGLAAAGLQVDTGTIRLHRTFHTFTTDVRISF